jgi:Na+/phosphate symporter
MYVQANSDDPNLAVRWVPTQPILVTESMHDAELVAGSLMAGVKVRPRAGQDPTQMMMGLLKSVGEIADGILAASQTPTKREVAGLANIAQAINGYMNLSAQDPANKDLVADVRKQLAALVRQLVQWNQQLMEQSQEGNGGVDPKIAKELALTQAKVEGMQAQIQAKIQADNAKNAQRIGQREEQFQQKQRQLEEQHIATLRKKLQDTQVETTIADAKAATEIQNDRMATMAELDQGEPPNA